MSTAGWSPGVADGSGVGVASGVALGEASVWLGSSVMTPTPLTSVTTNPSSVTFAGCRRGLDGDDRGRDGGAADGPRARLLGLNLLRLLAYGVSALARSGGVRRLVARHGTSRGAAGAGIGQGPLGRRSKMMLASLSGKCPDGA